MKYVSLIICLISCLFFSSCSDLTIQAGTQVNPYTYDYYTIVKNGIPYHENGRIIYYYYRGLYYYPYMANNHWYLYPYRNQYLHHYHPVPHDNRYHYHSNSYAPYYRPGNNHNPHNKGDNHRNNHPTNRDHHSRK